MGPEAKIQKAVVDYARLAFGPQLIVRKNQAGRFGTNGYPDYEFNAVNGYTWFMEFKAPGKQPTPLQMRRIQELARLGFVTYVCDDAAVGKSTVKAEMTIAINAMHRTVKPGKFHKGSVPRTDS